MPSSVAQFCPTLCDSMDSSPPGPAVPGDSPGCNAGVGCHALFQGIFPTEGLNQPGLPYCRQIPYRLSHQGVNRASDEDKGGRMVLLCGGFDHSLKEQACCCFSVGWVVSGNDVINQLPNN